MRNLFLLLLLSNLLFFGWQRWVFVDNEKGVNIVKAPKSGEQIELAAAQPNTPVQIALESIDSEPEELPVEIPAFVGRACVSIGPFSEVKDAAGELAQLKTLGMQAAQRATQGDVFMGHWVHVNAVPSRASGRRLVTKLHDGGIKDAYLIIGDAGDNTISLGLFSEEEGAERVELRAKSLGIDPVITRRYRQATVHWLDVRLQAAADGSQLAQTYGEERVLLRDEATCPPEE